MFYTDLHHTGGGEFIVFVVVRTILPVGFPTLLRCAGTALSLHTLWLQRIILELLPTRRAFRNDAFSDITEDLVTHDLIITLDARGRRERPVALHDVFR